jgi:hypothetical protein
VSEIRDPLPNLRNGLQKSGWWPCERCGESPWPQQVQLCADGYRCDPCRGGMYPMAVKATTGAGQAAMRPRRPVVPLRHVIPQLRRIA